MANKLYKTNWSEDTELDINSKLLHQLPLCDIIEQSIRKFSSKSLNSNLIISIENDDNIALEELDSLIENFNNNNNNLIELPDRFKDKIRKIPKCPKKPENIECCGSGCCPCIWDTYDRDLEKRQRLIESVHDSLNE